MHPLAQGHADLKKGVHIKLKPAVTFGDHELIDFGFFQGGNDGIDRLALFFRRCRVFCSIGISARARAASSEPVVGALCA